MNPTIIVHGDLRDEVITQSDGITTIIRRKPIPSFRNEDDTGEQFFGGDYGEGSEAEITGFISEPVTPDEEDF